MKLYFEVLEDFDFKIAIEQSNSKWTVVGMPAKIEAQTEETKNVIQASKDRYKTDMLSEQKDFEKSLTLLEAEVKSFSAFDDLNDVDEVNLLSQSVLRKLEEADKAAQLFNSREGLFDVEMTDYEALSRIKKNFEPYFNLWDTANTWLKSSGEWLNGEFLELDPEACEAQVETNLNTISKVSEAERGGGRVEEDEHTNHY